MAKVNHAMRVKEYAEVVVETAGVRRPVRVPPFRELVRGYLEERGISQYQLSRLLDIQQPVISRWIMGHTPDARGAIRFARLIGLDPRLVLASAGIWPEDIPVRDAVQLLPGGREAAVRPLDAVAARGGSGEPDVEEPDVMDRIVAAVRGLTGRQQADLAAFLESITAA